MYTVFETTIIVIIKSVIYNRFIIGILNICTSENGRTICPRNAMTPDKGAKLLAGSPGLVIDQC